MLDYQMFVEVIISRMKEYYGDTCAVNIQRITKNNRSGELALTILEKDCNISPAILLRPYYLKYLDGTSLDGIEEQIHTEYQAHRFDGQMDTDCLRDWAAVRDHIICRVIGADQNRKMLEGAPHSRFLDLAVVYYYQIAVEGELQASMLIRSEYLPMWGVTEEELKEQAALNTKALFPPQLLNMYELIGTLVGTDDALMESPEKGLYVLTNSRKIFGAYWITQEKELETVRDKLGEDFLILPSSIHEAIILPMHMNPDIPSIAQMVEFINKTEVAQEEVLTDSVYSYKKGKGISLETAAS